MRKLRILDFGSPDVKQKISKDYGLGDEGRGFHVPFENILHTVERNGCTAVIIEEDYVDKDYLDEYSHFYSTTFKTYARFCTRFHFFKGNIRKDLDLSDKQDELLFTRSYKDVLQKDYLGFCVIRPKETNKVSRTVISPYIEDPHKEFILTQSSCKIDLHGTMLKPRGMPFLHQDAQAGICASACLVMLSTRLWPFSIQHL